MTQRALHGWLIGLAGFGVALASTGCGGRGSAETRTSPEVLVHLAAVRDTVIAPPIRATGILSAKEEVPLSFKVGGVIAEIAVQEGESVRAGQTLAVIELPEIDATVAKAEAAARKAERDLNRARALYADSVVTREVLENAETGHEVATSDLKIARYNQGRASIAAPSDGVVLRRLAEPGQLVGPGTPVLHFGARHRGEVLRSGLPDRDAARVRLGDPIEVAFAAFPGPLWTGRVSRLGASAQPGAGTYEVEMTLDRPVAGEPGGRSFASGLVGSVLLRPTQGESARVIPVLSLMEGDGDRAFVWTLDAGDRPVKVPVLVGHLAGDRAIVRDGLRGVERVVADGASYLDTSSHVRVAGD